MLLDLLIKQSARLGEDFVFFRLRDLELDLLQPDLEVRIIRTVAKAVSRTEAPEDKIPGMISNGRFRDQVFRSK